MLAVVHRLCIVLSSARTPPESIKIIEWLSCMLLPELRLCELFECVLRIIHLLKHVIKHLPFEFVLDEHCPHHGWYALVRTVSRETSRGYASVRGHGL